MQDEKKFQSRIAFTGDLSEPLNLICRDYELGGYKSHEVVLVGYEDFNVILQTSKGKYFVKFFGEFRSIDECDRNVEIIKKTIEAGVSEPAIFESSQGFISRFLLNRQRIRAIVLEYIDGKTFYDLGRSVTESEAREIVRQGSLINSVGYQPKFIYDSWAIPSFLKEYTLVKDLLPHQDRLAVEPLVQGYQEIKIQRLPHALVHGDIIKTNVMLSKDGTLYIIDFSVSNYYPRIQELAVILCNLLFDQEHPEAFTDFYQLALHTYQEKLVLTPEELSALPLFIKLQHAMHIVGAVREEKIKKNTPSAEDEYWLNQGRTGLAFMENFRG